jgi:hypothetical protein
MKRILVLAAAAAALQGCTTFYAEAEQPLVCLTLPAQSFVIPGGGIVAPPEGFSGTYAGNVDIGLSNVVPDFLFTGASKDRILHFLSFDASVSGALGANLDFLSNLDVVAQGNAGSAPVELAHYVRTGTNVRSISLASDAPGVNLTDLLANGGLTLSLSGDVFIPGGQTVPAQWSAQISSCFYAKVHKTLQEIIDGT